MEAPALVMVRERAVQEHMHAAVVAGHQSVDQVAREALTSVLRLDHKGCKFASSVGVQPYLRDADDSAIVVGHEEPRPMKAARIESGLADQRRDVCLSAARARRITGVTASACQARHQADHPS
jgi:hypothetical protein